MKQNINEGSMGGFRFVAGPEEFYDILQGVPNGRKVTFGYVTAAKINYPKMKIKNTVTNRMNTVNDYATFGKNLGVEGDISGVIKLSIYNFNWQDEKNVSGAYGQFKSTRDSLAQKYGVEVKKPAYQTQTMNFGAGVSSYNGMNPDNQEHTYTNLNTANIKPISVKFYLVMGDGSLQEVDKERLEMLPYKPSETIIDRLIAAGASEDEVAPLRTMNYQRFEHSHLLFFSATSDGVPTIFINTKLSDKIGGITCANTDAIINLAKERYSAYLHESRTVQLTSQDIMEMVKVAAQKMLKEIR